MFRYYVGSVVLAAGIAINAACQQAELRTMDCLSVDVSQGPLLAVDGLIAAGWAGVPGDGSERLYAPSCGYKLAKVFPEKVLTGQ